MVVAAHNLVKRYGGSEVVRRVSFEINAGEVLGLVGENGAGKSTLVAMLSGATAPDGGSIVVDGVESSALDPAQARRLGIGAVRQEPVLVPTLSVMENMLIGREPRRFGILQRREARATAQEWLTRVGARVSPDAIVGDLSPADRQFVEIARVVGGRACVVFFDEPTAVLGPAETQRLFEVVRRLADERTAVVYVSHRLEEIFEICQRVVVMRDGSLVADRPVAGLDEDTLIALIAGRELAAEEQVREAHPKSAVEPILVLRGISASGRLHGIDLEVRPGETHGVFGIVGSGRSRLTRVIAGLERPSQGQMVLGSRPYAPRSPREAIDAGVILVPEDRLRSALFGELTQATNVLIGHHSQVARAGWLSHRDEARAALPFMARLAVRPLAPAMPGRTLSGGNQQKLILARALYGSPRVLILDEPTRGVDVGSKVEIHQFIREQAAAGVAVLVISSDLRELRSLADRITVLARGRTVSSFAGDVDGEQVIAAATGTR